MWNGCAFRGSGVTPSQLECGLSSHSAEVQRWPECLVQGSKGTGARTPAGIHLPAGSQEGACLRAGWLQRRLVVLTEGLCSHREHWALCPPPTCTGGESPGWRARRSHSQLLLKKSPLNRTQACWLLESDPCSEHPVGDSLQRLSRIQISVGVSAELTGGPARHFCKRDGFAAGEELIPNQEEPDRSRCAQ